MKVAMESLLLVRIEPESRRVVIGSRKSWPRELIAENCTH